MKTEPNDPITGLMNIISHDGSDYPNIMLSGLTKREYFAGLAMQGLLTAGDSVYPKNEIAKEAVQIADALITALNS